MVSPKEEENAEKIVYGIKLSSVGPAKVTGTDVVHEPTSMDLAMKLHYLRGVYYFSSQAVGGLTIAKIKESMFSWLNHLYMTSGRFRRSSESGRPYIKCNDCGVRFIEAHCSKTLQECIDLIMNIDASLHKQFVSNQVIGPELIFSPPVLLQITWFKCGGMSVGLSYAHVLGDVFSVSNFINLWGQILSGHNPNPIPIEKSYSLTERSANPQPIIKEPVSMKQIDPVGDHWVIPNNCKMDICSFHVSAAQLSQLQSKISSGPNEIDKVGSFECLCALFWKCVAQIREGPSPNKVTVCRNGNLSPNIVYLSNTQIISPVEANLTIKEAGLKELATLLVDQSKSEQTLIERAVEIDPGTSDFIVYGANLTFANWEEAALYGLEFNGQKPVLVNYIIDSIGDGGVILVLPGSPKDGSSDGKDASHGRTVTAILPENEMLLFKAKMSRENGLFSIV